MTARSELRGTIGSCTFAFAFYPFVPTAIILVIDFGAGVSSQVMIHPSCESVSTMISHTGYNPLIQFRILSIFMGSRKDINSYNSADIYAQLARWYHHSLRYDIM